MDKRLLLRQRADRRNSPYIPRKAYKRSTLIDKASVRSGPMRTSLFITLIASIIISTAAFSFSQQSDEPPKRAKKPPDVSSRKKHHPKPRQYFIYDQEYKEYQESPTIVINIQGANKETATPEEIPEGPQSSGAMIIEKRGDVYERIDRNSPVPQETPSAAGRNTPPNPGTGACLNCKVR